MVHWYLDIIIALASAALLVATATPASKATETVRRGHTRRTEGNVSRKNTAFNIGRPAGGGAGGGSKKTVTCRLVVRETEFEDSADPENQWDSSTTECEVQKVNGRPHTRGQMKELKADAWLRAHKRDIVTGETYVTIPEVDEGDLRRGVVSIPQAREREDLGMVRKPRGGRLQGGVRADDTDHHRHRSLVTSGTREVLVVRMVAGDTSTSASVSTLSREIFGPTNLDPLNMKSRYFDCSYGELNMEPSSASPTEVVGGVVEVNLGDDELFVSETNNTVVGQQSSKVRDAATRLLTAQFGDLETMFDHVMYCLPSGTLGSWVAYAYANHWMSVYNDNKCLYPSYAMHEIGHNLGLAHSNEGGATYQDQTGMMGFSYSQDDGPYACFNGPKSWQMGWYADRHHSIYPPDDGEWTGRLYGIANYGDTTPTDGPVIVRIETRAPGSEGDYYVAFNRKTGINSGSFEGIDQVHVTQQDSGYSTSSLLKKLFSTNVYSIDDFDGLGSTVAVRVNEIQTTTDPWYADVTIGFYEAPTISPAPTPAPFSCPVGCRFRCSIATDNYPDETAWTLEEMDGTVISSGGPYVQQYVEHSNEECLSPGHYIFTITDNYGDGLTYCSQGVCGYNLTMDGVEIASGGDFGSSQAVPFTVGDATFPPTVSPTTSSPTSSPTTSSPTTAQPTSSFVELLPTDDTYVYSTATKADTNYGNAGVLFLRKASSSDRKALLKFDLGGVPSGNAEGTLRLYVSDIGGSGRSIVVKRIADAWDESTVTWNNLSPVAEQTGRSFAVADGDLNSWVEVDVSELLQTLGGSTLVLMLEHDDSSTGDKCVFRSQNYNSGELAPKLLYASGEGVTVTASPTSEPTLMPATDLPTASPISDSPTASPITESPTASPITESPTASPITESPTASPITESPTASPITDLPTDSPISDSPTASPVTGSPTVSPVTGRPTASPDSPTNSVIASLSPTSTPVELLPMEDTYVYSSVTKQYTNYGSSTILYLQRGNAERKALLKFDLGEVPSGAAQAKLSLYVSILGGSGDRIILVERIADTWDEKTATWDNLDLTVEQVGTTFAVANTDLDTRIEVDVSDILQTLSGTTLIMMLRHDDSSSGGKCIFSSRDQGGENVPKLLYSSGTAGAATVTDSPTASPITDAPTASFITDAPTASPTTDAPTASPATESPTASPTGGVTSDPTGMPTLQPTLGSISSLSPTTGGKTFFAFEDAYIWSGSNALKNYGTKNVLYLKKAENERRVLIKFDLQTLSSHVSEAKLRLGVTAVGGDPSRTIMVSRLADTPAWAESTVTWDNFSAAGEEIGISFDVADSDVGQWVEVDVTNLTNNRGGTELNLLLGLVDTGIGNKCVFGSRENGMSPELLVK